MRVATISRQVYITDTTGTGSTHRRLVDILLRGHPVTCDVVLRAKGNQAFEQATREAFNTPIQILWVQIPADCEAF